MSTNNQPLARAKGTSTLARPKFGPGMLLQHDDLEQLNVYTRELNRLMFRSLFGCGVVCGLVVGTQVKCGKVNVTVGSGLALDCQGDPIYVPKPQTIVLDEECDPDMDSPLWVVLCGTVKCCAPRTSMCASDEDESPSVCTRERDGYEIRIVRNRPQCVCSCPEPDQKYPTREWSDRTRDRSDNKCKCVDPENPCYVDHYAGKCGCDCEDCANCDCDCVLLARLEKSDKDLDHPVWTTDHRVRRFVRPVLMRDPQVEIEEEARKYQQEQEQEPKDQGQGAEQQQEPEQQPEQLYQEKREEKDRYSQAGTKPPRERKTPPKRS